MAFGRSNSLSLNTGAVNSSFAAQQQQTSQPAAGTSLFGGTTGGSSLFGGQQNTQNTQTTQAPAGNSLFGGAPAAQTPQPAGNSLFGGGQNTQTSQPAGGSSLFGGSLFGNQQNQAQNAQQPATSSLFGGQASQAASGGNGLFGGQQGQTKPMGGSLFGSGQTGQQQQQPQQQQQQSQTGGLFGSSMQNTNQPSNSLFGSLNQPQQQQQQQQQQSVPQPSLLSASRYNQSQFSQFTGRLSMGQGSTPQASSTPATKLDWQNVRPTTRYNDLVDSAKEQLEQVDKMIQAQEAYCRQIDAFLPKHEENVGSLLPDVELVTNTCEEAEQSLVTDAQGVNANKQITQKDGKDVLRLDRIAENLRLPAQYLYAPASSMYASRQSSTANKDTADNSSYDVDLVNNYFFPLSQDLTKLLATYNANLSEIESHMQIIEASAVAQAQQLAQQRMSGGADQVGADSVRQLAETLRGFEASIMGVASKVGACREGVNEVALGRVGSQGSRRQW